MLPRPRRSQSSRSDLLRSNPRETSLYQKSPSHQRGWRIRPASDRWRGIPRDQKPRSLRQAICQKCPRKVRWLGITCNFYDRVLGLPAGPMYFPSASSRDLRNALICRYTHKQQVCQKHLETAVFVLFRINSGPCLKIRRNVDESSFQYTGQKR